MKTYTLNLDRDRELRFGFKAMRDIRLKFGDRTVDQLMNIKIDEIPILVWAGLKWEDKNLTVDQVEGLLDNAIPAQYTIMQITEVVMGALAAQMGIESKKDKAGGTEKKEEKPEAVAEKKQPTETIPSTKKQKK